MTINDAIALYEERKYDEVYEAFVDLATYERNAEAQYYLGRMYRDGDGVQKSEEKAVYWWKKARQQGHRDAAFAASELQISTKNMF
ncbi:MAG: SEL1-like repeat protein [Campylobacterota bacterium]|nr:SEL1-like repeat protein [Campylobacterota bacterium]